MLRLVAGEEFHGGAELGAAWCGGFPAIGGASRMLGVFCKEDPGIGVWFVDGFWLGGVVYHVGGGGGGGECAGMYAWACAQGS